MDMENTFMMKSKLLKVYFSELLKVRYLDRNCISTKCQCDMDHPHSRTGVIGIWLIKLEVWH